MDVVASMIEPKLRTLALGWGVQSWTLAAMSALGKLPRLDAAIHGNTGWEKQATYDFAKAMEPWLEKNGVPVVTVYDSSAHGMIKDEWEGTFAPLYTFKPGKNPKRKQGQLRRQCTGRWKIRPIRSWIRTMMEVDGLKRRPGVVEQWLGITTDEILRAKDSDVKYIAHRYPLLELNMSRNDCVRWLQQHNLPIPVKSACTFCPYHSLATWKAMKKENGRDWQQAIMVDEKVRDNRPPYKLYVHPARVPLEEAVDIPEDHGFFQTYLFDEECDSGFCFL